MVAERDVLIRDQWFLGSVPALAVRVREGGGAEDGLDVGVVGVDAGGFGGEGEGLALWG